MTGNGEKKPQKTALKPKLMNLPVIRFERSSGLPKVKMRSAVSGIICAFKIRGTCSFLWLTLCLHSHTGSPGSRRGTYSHGSPAFSLCVSWSFFYPFSNIATFTEGRILPGLLCCVCDTHSLKAPAAVTLIHVCICLTGQSIKMFIRGRPITMYIPSNIQNYEELKMELPSQRLELDWVYPCIMDLDSDRNELAELKLKAGTKW